MSIVLITPTGARPEQFEICAGLMKAQDYKDKVLWIIVDDAEPITTDNVQIDFRENWAIKKIYPHPVWEPGQNTQGRNLAAGINEAKKHKVDAIFIIEDDDYYKPCYLRLMTEKLKGYDIAGEMNTIYYNVKLRRWIENKNDVWSSLFQTCFTPKVIPIFEKLYGEKFIDFVLFRQVKKVNLFDEKWSIGIKGQNGRAGIGAGHQWLNHMAPDPELKKLKELIGNDVKYYDRISGCI